MEEITAAGEGEGRKSLGQKGLDIANGQGRVKGYKWWARVNARDSGMDGRKSESEALLETPGNGRNVYNVF